MCSYMGESKLSGQSFAYKTDTITENSNNSCLQIKILNINIKLIEFCHRLIVTIPDDANDFCRSRIGRNVIIFQNQIWRRWTDHISCFLSFHLQHTHCYQGLQTSTPLFTVRYQCEVCDKNLKQPACEYFDRLDWKSIVSLVVPAQGSSPMSRFGTEVFFFWSSEKNCCIIRLPLWCTVMMLILRFPYRISLQHKSKQDFDSNNLLSFLPSDITYTCKRNCSSQRLNQSWLLYSLDCKKMRFDLPYLRGMTLDDHTMTLSALLIFIHDCDRLWSNSAR